MKIITAIIIQRSGRDEVVLKTDLPSPYSGFIDDPLHLKFDCPLNMGTEYVKTHFDIDAKMILKLKQ